MSKPAILQDQEFVVEEGFLYKAMRTGAIWTNKLFFSSLVLLIIWLLYGYAVGAQDCVEGLGQSNNTTEELAIVEEGTCSVLLSTTAKYLGVMTIVSFLLSMAFGVLGLIVGKRVFEATQVAEEVGSEEHAGEAPPGQDADDQE